MRLKRIEPIAAINKKTRVCAYARVSTDSLKQADSFENQVSTYERTLSANPAYEFVGIYADQGVSGRREDRPEFQRMLADARDGKFDLIVTKSISRFARNTTTVLKYVRELKELGVGIFFEENNINTLSSEGEIMITVLASFAEEESRSIGENNRWTLKKKFERGEGMVNTNRFMGYDKDETGDLIINKKEAEIVRRIYMMYLSGEGMHRICKILNEEGVPTVTGASWNAGTIKNMLTNEKYKGDFWIQKFYTPPEKHSSRPNDGRVQSYYVSDNHPAIVSEEEWQQVQELMAYRRKERHISDDRTAYQKRYPLSGMLICPYCGKNLRRRVVYGGKIDWICATYIHKGKDACKGVRVHDTELTNINIQEPTVVEEVIVNGEKHYGYTSKRDYDAGIRAADRLAEKESGSVLPRVNRPRRTVIKL